MMQEVIKKLKRMVSSGEWDAPDRMDPLEAGARAAIYLAGDPGRTEEQRAMLKRWAMETPAS